MHILYNTSGDHLGDRQLCISMLDIVYFRYFAYKIQTNLYDIYDISLRFRFQMQGLQQCLLPYHRRRGFVFSHQKWPCLFSQQCHSC